MTFGEALQAVREAKGLSGPELATAALGQRSTATKVTSWANYLSKIEHDKIPSVGLDRVRAIASGLGYARLSQFFAVIEEVQDKGKEFVTESLRDAKASDKTTLSVVRTPGGDRGKVPAILSADETARQFLLNVAEHIIERARPTFHQQVPKTRARRSRPRGRS
jgi:transcriptional regulator with XRE-family HTH domain